MTTTATTPVLETQPAPAPVAAGTGLATSSLVLAIVGIVLGQGLISVAAIIVAFVSRAKEPAGRLLANWGLALGFAGLFGGLLLALLGIAAFAPLWIAGAFAGLY
ncbi:MAG TPA: hypothetical protein VL294_12735 [Pseudolysinimonas sp.]|jgi:hypothetical protein|nr:hypothetical protein [Pseudolysinimonas sp.]